MKSILVIFNGIRFPYYLMEYVIGRAKNEDASIHALFLRAKHDSAQGYIFPNDMSNAETLTNSEDALKDDENIISKQMKLARRMAESENIDCTLELRTGSPIEEVLDIIKNYDLLCLDALYDDNTSSMLTNDLFTSRELIESSPSPVEEVSESTSYR